MDQQAEQQRGSSSLIECPSCGYHIATFQMELKFVPTYTCPSCGNDTSNSEDPARI